MGKVRVWTNEKLAKLKEIYADTPNDELAKIFNVTIGSIESVAVRHELKKSKEHRSSIMMGKLAGEKNAMWRGGLQYTKQGIFIRVPNHPHNQKGYVLGAKTVMEKHLGRYMQPNESISYKDGNNHNINIENLTLVTNDEHDGSHKSPLYKAITKEDILALREQRWQVREICEFLGISLRTYYRKMGKK